MKKKAVSWRPGRNFYILCVALLALGTLFAALPSIALLVQDYDSSPVGPFPFPVTVDPVNKQIIEKPEVEELFSRGNEPLTAAAGNAMGVLARAAGMVAEMPWYQNIASVGGRVVVIDPGERKEEVALAFSRTLGWSSKERQALLDEHKDASTHELSEGNFTPGTYLVQEGAKASDVQAQLDERFEKQILERYTPEVAAQVPLEDALTIASMLEREAGNAEEMRIISGIIWNRIFADMRLQIDATLQYAKANQSKTARNWWPRVVPRDKYIKSPYNTYLNEGLPPGPIANPSLAAVAAALSPKKTDCMFYFHDDWSNFYCSETYEEHVAMLKEKYGRGK